MCFRTINQWFETLAYRLASTLCCSIDLIRRLHFQTLLILSPRWQFLRAKLLFYPLHIMYITSTIREWFLTAQLQRFSGTHRHLWNPSWLYHHPFRAPLPTSLLNHAISRGVNFTVKVFRCSFIQGVFFTEVCFKRIFLPRVYSFQRE